MDFNDIIDFFIPQKCILCGSYNEGIICSGCFNTLEQIKPESFVSRKISKNWEIEPDLQSQTYLTKVYYFYYYNNLIHELITEIKYRGNVKLIPEILNLIYLSNEFRKIDFSEIEYLTFVPLHKSKEKERGFNQCEIITQYLSEKLQKPYLPVLDKIKATKNQADLNRKERLENLKNAFNIKKCLSVDLNGKKILLIDDICSTGSTLNECAKAIKHSFPDAKIYGFCLARGKD